MFVYFIRVLAIAQQLEQIVISQEIEPRKRPSLSFQQTE
jgi:hypothetical protein